MADPAYLVDETLELVAAWLDRARSPGIDRAAADSLRRLVADPSALAFTESFIDRVARPEDGHVAGAELRSLVARQGVPRFLAPFDRLLLAGGAVFGPLLPAVVVPLARARLRQLVGHLVVDRSPARLTAHLRSERSDGFAQNVNLLGEAVLGRREAQRRLDALLELIADPEVDYVSVKLSSVVAQLNHWDWTGSLGRVVAVVGEIVDRAAATDPPTFVNLDMEEYLDLELTTAAFQTVLDDRRRRGCSAGIVLQAYLPDSLPALRDLVDWATTRARAGGGEIKIRLVKGANLAMERVDAAMHGWEQAPYPTKGEVDANYKRCLDWVLTPARTSGVRIGVASHNLFDVAWAHLVASERGVSDRVQFEMLQGMAPAQARVVRDAADANPLLLYTPVVDRDHFDVAISYLFRRLDENAAPENYLHALFDLRPGTRAFSGHAAAFRRAVADRLTVDDRPRRRQDRPATLAVAPRTGPFANEPDTDPALAANRRWVADAIATAPGSPTTALTTDPGDVDAVLDRARAAGPSWAGTPGERRRALLLDAADELARRRGPLIAAMVHEAGKTVAEADPEVSEAVDFARYYADRATELGPLEHARFEPLGAVAVIPPWNFPVSIPMGGTLAALAAGNTVVLKPAPESPRCAEIAAECLWAAGIPSDVLQVLRTPDDDAGQRLVTGADGVVLTGSVETAALFRDWRPELPLFAETSGKNALVITPSADIDLAVSDLVASAFGHAGQKCSAASLAICVGTVASSPRFLRQLRDAVESLEVGPATALGSTVGPLIGPPPPKLRRALLRPGSGERWLVRPRLLDEGAQLWSPGVLLGVEPGTWFHQTECFGPVLGVMAARDLDQAIDWQNGTPFGLTGGIHTLDPEEIDRWVDRVEVGNAYVNRSITGAIVQRQPFGGWKQSGVGPGAKAGGPNYVAQLGTWHPTTAVDDRTLDVARRSDRRWWNDELDRDHDPSGLAYEDNVFRYRPLPKIAIRIGADADVAEVDRVLAARRLVGCGVVLSRSGDESDEAFGERLPRLGVARVRVIGDVSSELARVAAPAGVHLARDPVTLEGRVELRHFVREQVVSRTRHRMGHLPDRRGPTGT